MSAANVADVADKILRKQFNLLSAPAANVAKGGSNSARYSARYSASCARCSASCNRDQQGGIRVEHIGIGLTLTALILLIVVTQRATNKNSKRE